MRKSSKEFSPFGDAHPVSRIEGIGPVYTEALGKLGITNTQQLWESDAATVSKKTGAPLVSVISWRNMAGLARIKDIGPQYSELLERSGVHNIEQLKRYKTNDLLRLVSRKQDSLKVNIQGNTPGYDLVQNWIQQAHDHSKYGGGYNGKRR